jgi:hypothetical protein
MNNTLCEVLDKNIYVHEKDEYGHLVIILKELVGIKNNKKNVELFINKIISEVKKSLEISRKYDKTRGYVHVYFTDCSIMNAPISLFKKVNNVLTSQFEDTVEQIFIYSNSMLIKKLWTVIKYIVDSDTRDKVRIIKIS